MHRKLSHICILQDMNRKDRLSTKEVIMLPLDIFLCDKKKGGSLNLRI